MISPESRTKAWIESLRSQYPNIKDVALLEKSIRAFSRWNPSNSPAAPSSSKAARP